MKKYKVKYNDKNYIVKAGSVKDALSALDYVFSKVNDDRLSPMTYKKLKELGYSNETWKDLTQEQANKIVHGSQNNSVQKTSEYVQTNKNNTSSSTALEYDKNKLNKLKIKNKNFVDKMMSLVESQSTKDFVRAVNAKKYYEIDDLKKLPVLKEMDNLIREYEAENISDTSLDNSKERQEQRDYIFNTLMQRGSYNGEDENGNAKFDGKLKNEGKVVIAIGLPAAGKSSAVAEPMSQKLGAYVVDSDEAKFLDPLFIATNGIAANSIHEDSQKIVHKVMDELIKTKTNLVIPIIGAKANKIKEKWINQLLASGYKKEDIEIQLKQADTKQSVNRVVRRAITKGRPILSSVIFKYKDGPSHAIKQLEQEGFKTSIH
jgi:hypothetical protein